VNAPVTGGLMIGLATLAGAWLARRHAARRELCCGAAAGALLVIAGIHLLPDAWQGARQAGIPAWMTPVAAFTAFAVAGIAIRRGCNCQADREAAGGAGTGAALAVHRLLEGAALMLAGSATVVVALTVHALAEGLAAGTLLTSASRRERVLWLTVMCTGPLVGAALAAPARGLASAEPILLAVAAGVLAQTARVSLNAAFRPDRVASSRPVTAMLVAAAVTARCARHRLRDEVFPARPINRPYHVGHVG
jgi:ZIP family zinc transporter